MFDTLPAWVTFTVGIIGLISTIGLAAFYLKFTATKSNLEGKAETIETLEKSRDAYKERNVELEKIVAGLQAENKSLREIATQTPEILQLTKVVTESVQAQNRVAKNVAIMTNKLTQFIGKSDEED